MLEALPTFLGAADETVAKEACEDLHQARGSTSSSGVKITEVSQSKKGVNVQYTGA